MDNKPSNGHKKERSVSAPREDPIHCPVCGITNRERLGLDYLDQLLQSHDELRTILRLAGRQISQSETGSDQSLDRIRRTLKRASNIRQGLTMTEYALEPIEQVHDQGPESPTLDSPYSDDLPMTDSPLGNNVRRRRRLARPRALRVLSFPTL